MRAEAAADRAAKAEKDWKRVSTKEIAELIANVARAKSNVVAAGRRLELERAKEQRLTDQIKACLIHAPSDGVLKYATRPPGDKNQIPLVELGASVRGRQLLFTIVPVEPESKPGK